MMPQPDSSTRYCSACGAKHLLKHVHCLFCGESLEATSPKFLSENLPEQRGEHRFSQVLVESSSFVASSGRSKLEHRGALVPASTCSFCGAPTRDSVRYCTTCGINQRVSNRPHREESEPMVGKVAYWIGTICPYAVYYIKISILIIFTLIVIRNINGKNLAILKNYIIVVALPPLFIFGETGGHFGAWIALGFTICHCGWAVLADLDNTEID